MRNNRNTPFRLPPTQHLPPADPNGLTATAQASSPKPVPRSDHPISPTRGQLRSPKVPAGSQTRPGKLRSPAVQKTTMPGNSRSPAIEKCRRNAESSLVKDFGMDADLDRFNTTESDEDIAKACGQMEDKVSALLYTVISELLCVSVFFSLNKLMHFT